MTKRILRNRPVAPKWSCLALALLAHGTWSHAQGPNNPNPAAPIVESGDNTISPALPATPTAQATEVPPPISPPAADPTVPPPITGAAPTSDTLPPRADDNAPLPTEVPPINSDPTASGVTEVGQPAGQPVEPISPLLTESTPVEPTLPPIMNTGKKFQLSLAVDSVYDDNVFFSSKDPTSDYIFVASPKLTLQTGDFRVKEETFAVLNYNPQAIFFAKGTDENTLDQNLKTEIQYTIARLAINLEAGYQRLSGATPDLGDRVDRDQTSAKIRLSYGWGPKFEAETSFLYTGMNYDRAGLADFSEFVNETFLRYQLTARTKAAFGVAIGRLEVDGFGHQDFQRLLVQVIGDIGAKLTLKAKGGVEFRQMDLDDQTTPVFALAADYALREGTTLGLEAYREVAASGGAPGENITRTGVSAKLKQRFGNSFTGGVSAGYEQLAYSSKGVNGGGRDDSYFFVRPSLQYELKEGRRFELYYLHRDNDSSTDDFSFSGNQIGASVEFDF